MKIWILLLLLLAKAAAIYGQKDSVWKQKPELSVSGFIDVFYATDFSKSKIIHRQSFLYNHNRRNEFNLNLGLVKLAVIHPRYRAHLGFQAGTYVTDNYTGEPSALRYVHEANVGLALDKKSKWWLDAGIFSSYIGMESAVSADNWTLTRSLLAENSPYYETGAKLIFSPGKWSFSALLLNGWQRIQKIPGNSFPSFGSQVVYKPNDKIKLNHSLYAGSEFPDDQRRWRYYSDLYVIYKVHRQVGLSAAFDIGLQQRSTKSESYDVWFSPVIMVRYQFLPAWTFTLRGEYFSDVKGVVVYNLSIDPFRASGCSFNVDYSPVPAVICRIEGRWMTGKDRIYLNGQGTFEKNNLALIASIAIRLEKKILERTEGYRGCLLK